MTEPQGIIALNIDMETYAKHEAYNATVLKMVDTKSLSHVQAYLTGKLEDDSDEKAFGKAFHSMLLEDRQDFVIHPPVYPGTPKKKGDPVEMKPWNWTATYCKEWEAAQEKEVLSHAQSDALMGMIASIRANEDLAELLKGAKNEVSLFVEKGGTKYKARLDTLPVSGPIIDFKSAASANPKKFVRQAYDAGYFIQAALYLDLLAICGDKREEFWFVAVEKTPPYATSIIKLSDGPVSFLAMGRMHYRTALHRLKDAQKSGKWPGYGAIDAELVASVWMLTELENSI